MPTSTSRSPVAVLWQTVGTVREEQVTFLAAAIAYYAFVSLVPLLLLGLSIAAFLGGESFADRVVGSLAEVLTPEAGAVLREALQADAAAGGASVVGLVALTWSSLRVFRGLNRAFASVYGVEEVTFLDELRDATVVLGSVVVGVAAVAVAGAAIRAVDVPAAAPLAGLSLVATLVVVLLPLYYVLPDVRVTVREALPGTVLAAVGWAALGTLFGVYADLAGSSVYGVLGAVLLVITWLYFGAVLVLAGASLNATLGGVAVAGPPGIAGGDGDDRPGDGTGEETSDGDRQVQSPGRREIGSRMAESGDDAGDGDDADSDAGVGPGGDPHSDAGDPADRPLGAEDAESFQTELDRLWEELDGVEDRLDDRTVSREQFEREMKRYVRRRVRRSHARGWGPYLVLLYGTVMTLGAFFYLGGGWAILAMIVVWLSTLGLYVFMVVVGLAAGGLGKVGRLRDVLGAIR